MVQDYLQLGKDKELTVSEAKEKANHPWRQEMVSNLEELKEILAIDEIKTYLTQTEKLLLIPHQDLHRFPLHSFFMENELSPVLDYGEKTANNNGRRDSSAEAIEQTLESNTNAEKLLPSFQGGIKGLPHHI